jgi:hypothetical protein
MPMLVDTLDDTVATRKAKSTSSLPRPPDAPAKERASGPPELEHLPILLLRRVSDLKGKDLSAPAWTKKSGSEPAAHRMGPHRWYV